MRTNRIGGAAGPVITVCVALAAGPALVAPRERGSRHFATYARNPFSIEPGQTRRVPLTLSRHAAKFLEGDEYLGRRMKVADAEAHAERGVSLHFPRPAG